MGFLTKLLPEATTGRPHVASIPERADITAELTLVLMALFVTCSVVDNINRRKSMKTGLFGTSLC